MSFVLAGLIGYVLGSIPFGLILIRLAGLGDVRSMGSGNIGATNVLRTGRKDIAVVTALLDGGKGAVAVFAVGGVFAYHSPLMVCAGVAAFVGHCFPVWLRFRGGKGVATFLGVTLALFWPAGVGVCAIWLGVAVATRLSSLAALIAVSAAPVMLFLVDQIDVAMGALIMAGLVFYHHKANILRLAAGTEPKIGDRGDSKSEACTSD